MTDRDTTDLARELLAADTSAIGGNTIMDGVDVLETTRAAQKVARAVIAAAELADQLREAAHESYQEDMDDAGDAYQAAANLIRAALNGDNHE